MKWGVMVDIMEGISTEDAKVLDRLVKTHKKQNMKVIELGTYTGKSSLTILPHVSEMDGRLYCIDWFKGMVNAPEGFSSSYSKINILDIFLERIKKNGFENDVITLVGKTDDIAPIIQDSSADIIFIDADHRYTSVRNDIMNWYPKLKADGLICGHDFLKPLNQCNYLRALEKCEEGYDLMFQAPHHYGVIRSVCEFFSAVNWDAEIWFATKTKDSDYLDFAYFVKERVKNGNVQNDKVLDREIIAKAQKVFDRHDYDQFCINSICSIVWEEQKRNEAIDLLMLGLSRQENQNDLLILSLYLHFLLLSGQLSNALEVAKKLYVLMPDDPVVVNKYGALLMEFGQHQEAEVMLKKALSLVEYHPDAVNNLGVLYWMNGHRTSALDFMKRGLEAVNWKDVSMVINYTQMLAESGDFKQAMALLEKHSEKTADDRVVEALKRLKAFPVF